MCPDPALIITRTSFYLHFLGDETESQRGDVANKLALPLSK